MQQVRYTPFYCEENIWWLAQAPALAGFARWVVFISNPYKTCALWSQRAAAQPAAPVVWDYHVVLLTRAESADAPSAADWTIWDLDSVAGSPLAARRWCEVTFPYSVTPSGSASGGRVQPRYAPWFRLIQADTFVRAFRSDRAHMRDASGVFLHPPPPWPAISAGENNLGIFVSMDPREDAFSESEVLDWGAWWAKIGGESSGAVR